MYHANRLLREECHVRCRDCGEEPEAEEEAPPRRDERFASRPVNHGKTVRAHNPYMNSA